MANEHPFQMLFETLGRVPIAHAESVNRQAYEILSDILSVPVEKPGRCILLRAPRAGHGKTHLLSRIQHQLGATHEFIPLHAAFGCQIDAATVIDDALRRLLRPLPASGGLCVLDLVTRRLVRRRVAAAGGLRRGALPGSRGRAHGAADPADRDLRFPSSERRHRALGARKFRGARPAAQRGTGPALRSADPRSRVLGGCVVPLRRHAGGKSRPPAGAGGCGPCAEIRAMAC